MVLDGVLVGPLRLARNTGQVTLYPCKHPTRRGEGPLKGTVSAQKGLQGTETETREFPGGTEEKVFPLRGVIDMHSRQIYDYFYPSGPPII